MVLPISVQCRPVIKKKKYMNDKNLPQYGRYVNGKYADRYVSFSKAVYR
jgi:hypothetical protein